jgi:hypothetical protein
LKAIKGVQKPMFKPYEKIEIPKNGKRVDTGIVVVRHGRIGMEGTAYPGNIVSNSGQIVTITVPYLGLSISVKGEDIKQVL